jgi:PAP2 superfamily
MLAGGFPPSAWGAIRRWTAHHYGLTQIAIVVAGVESYELARHLIEPNWPAANDNARRVIHFEQFTHLAWEQSLQRAFLEVPDLVKAMNVFYFVGHFVLTAVFFFWLYHSSRDGFRSFRNGFLAATAIALIIHWQFPTTPPRLIGGYVDTLRRLSNIDIGSPDSASFSNPVAAVPSLHAGWALGVGIGLWRYASSRVWQAVGVVYPIAVFLTIVVTGNHFVFDALAGVCVMGLGFLVASAISSRIGGDEKPMLSTAARGSSLR